MPVFKLYKYSGNSEMYIFIYLSLLDSKPEYLTTLLVSPFECLMNILNKLKTKLIISFSKSAAFLMSLIFTNGMIIHQGTHARKLGSQFLTSTFS